MLACRRNAIRPLLDHIIKPQLHAFVLAE